MLHQSDMKGKQIMMWKYFLAWFGMMILAILNGGIREMVYKQYFGNITAHQISTLFLLALISGYFWFLIKIAPMKSSNQAWIIGGMWFIMTEVFEFGMGVFSEKSSAELFQAYNIFAGQLWVLIPLWVMISPPLFYKYFQTNALDKSPPPSSHSHKYKNPS
jgi:hypothetical protein